MLQSLIKIFIFKSTLLESIIIFAIIPILLNTVVPVSPVVIIRKSRQNLKKNDFTSSVSAVLEECSDNRQNIKCKRNLLLNIRINPIEDTENKRTFVVIDEIYDAKKRKEIKIFYPYLIEIHKVQSILMYPLRHSMTVQCDKNEKNKKLFKFENENKNEESDDNLIHKESDGPVINQSDSNCNGRQSRNQLNFDEFKNQTLSSGPVDFRPEIKINNRYDVNEMETLKNINKNKLPLLRKLPSQPVLNPVPELQIMASSRIPLSLDYETGEFDDISFQNEQRFKRFENLNYKYKKNMDLEEKSTTLRSSEAAKKANFTKYEMYDINNPLPLLTTEIQIFQRREHKWLKMGPLVTLSTLSRESIAKSNISMVLSTHNDLFRLKRHTLLKNHSLLIPSYIFHTISRTDKRDFIIQSSRDSFLFFISNKLIKTTKKRRKIHGEEDSSESELIKRICMSIDFNEHIKFSKHEQYNNIENQQQQQQHQHQQINLNLNDLKNFNKSSNLEIFRFNKYEKFSKDINVLQKCKHDEKHLCLNMLNNNMLGAYTIKIQFPYHENTLIPNDCCRVRITDIMTDATTSGILQVSANVINVGYVAHEFAICIDNCLNTNKIKNLIVIKRRLLPNIVENIPFQLKFTDRWQSKKLLCDILVKVINGSNPQEAKTIAKRQFTAKHSMRCLCVQNCNCECLGRSIPHAKGFHCKKMSKNAYIEAGFRNYDEEYKISYVFCIIIFILLISLLALLLGILKAIIGLCLPKIEQLGYNLIHPDRHYDSKTRHFFTNILFFLCLPFVCCGQCIVAKKLRAEEERLLSSDFWECNFLRDRLYEISDDTNEEYYNKIGRNRIFDDLTDDEEETILSQRIEICNDHPHSTKPSADSDLNQRSKGGGGLIHDPGISYFNEQDGHITDDINDSDLEDKEAALFVQKLIDGKIVYRIFYHPIGGVDIEDFQQYSIRGYFIVAPGKGYKFITTIPTRQYFKICAKDSTLTQLPTPHLLSSNALSKLYLNRKDVCRQQDLSLEEPNDAPCINYLSRTTDSITNINRPRHL